eukprot:121096_1
MRAKTLHCLKLSVVTITIFILLQFYANQNTTDFKFNASYATEHIHIKTKSIIYHFLEHQHISFNKLVSQINDNPSTIDFNELTLVLGNEACDLDSMISSLLWSFYSQSQTKIHSNLFIPIFSIKQTELKLRKDAIYLFNQIDKSLINKFFFINTIQLNILLNTTRIKLNVHLVDHNALSISLHSLLKDHVTYIIDHHQDQHLYLIQCNNNSRNIHIVGSNSANIIQHILTINSNYNISLISSEFGMLINAAILLDTLGFDERVHKTTAIDIQVFKRFSKYNLMQNSEDWYQQLLELRSNTDGFSFYELLLKDLKMFMQNGIVFGVSEFTVSFESVVNTNGNKLFDVVEKFQYEKNLQLVFIGTAFCDKTKNNELQRQLVIFTDDRKLFDYVCEQLESFENGKYLDLKLVNIIWFMLNKKMYYRFWDMDITISRKQLVPVLQQILERYSYL